MFIHNHCRYDFHRGVDIPTPEGTPVYAIDGGKVRIAGTHPSYTDKLVQVKQLPHNKYIHHASFIYNVIIISMYMYVIYAFCVCNMDNIHGFSLISHYMYVQLEHSNWSEAVGTKFYSNYMHLLNASVSQNQIVSKGQLVCYSSHPASGFNHLHFEIRVGGLFQRHCCNPWKYLPNADNSYSTFNASLTLLPNPGSANCKANVTVSVPPDQLTFNRIELNVDANGQESIYTYDMCEENLSHTFSEMDDPNFDNFLIISPTRFSSSSYQNGESAGYLFQFYGLPSGDDVKVKAKIFDVFGNTRETSQMTLIC